MKSVKKALSALLVLMMVVAPMSAMAEGEKMSTVTVNNIVMKFNDLEPINIGLTAKNTFYADGEEFFLDGELMGGDSQIAKYKMASEDDTIKLALDGLGSNYTITEDELEKMFEEMQSSQMVAASSEMPFDQEDLQELMASYMKLIEAAKNMELKDQDQSLAKSVEMFKEMGIDVEPKLEQVELMGEQVELNRIDVKLTMADMDKMVKVTEKQIPELEEFMDDYFELMEKMMKASGEKIELDKDNLFTSLYKDMGMDIQMDMTMWMDDAGKNMRMEMIEYMTVTQDGVTETVQAPMTMQVKTVGEDTQMVMDMNMSQEEVELTMTMNMEDRKGETGENANFNLNMNVVPKDEKPVVMTIGGSYEQDQDGNNRVFKGDMLVSADGTDVHMGVNVVGTGVLSKGEVSKNTVELAMTANGENPGETFSFDLAFDIAIEESDRPAGVLMDISDKPVVSIARMDAEDMKQLESDAMTVGIMGYGAVMQTPGVAQLFTMLVEPYMFDLSSDGVVVEESEVSEVEDETTTAEEVTVEDAVVAEEDAQPAVEEIPVDEVTTEEAAA